MIFLQRCSRRIIICGMNAELDPKTVHIVNDTDTLNECIEKLKKSREVAVDTESDSLFVYFEKVCLIQISADGQSYVIDPLETGDLSPLNDIFSDPGVLKIFHAAEYDLMCLKRDFGFEFANLFDTMIAARMLGRKEIGLGSLLESEFDIHLDKHYQKANWGIRPLSREMLNYAVSDTRFLSMLKDKLAAELKNRDMEDIAQEDFDRLCQIHAAVSEPQEPVWWKVTGGVDLTPAEQGALQGLCEFRDKEAQIRDLPPFKILSNNALVDIAVENPANEKVLGKIKGVNGAVIRRYGKTILSINKAWRRKKNIPKPVFSARPCNGILSRRDRLKNWRKNLGIEMDVASDVILPRDILETIAEVGPKDEAALKGLMSEVPARYRRFGKEILQVSLNESESESIEE